MKIGYNAATMSAFNSLTSTTDSIEKAARILSSGLRVHTAADDAAGVAISTKISSQKSGADRAVKNTQDGVSLLQTAEGGLNQINSMLQRMRELAVEAANDSLTQQDRNFMQIEIDELKTNIDNLAHNTTFNSKRLLDGSSAGAWTTDNENTKVHINGSITEIDQFGQKKLLEGNYKIEVRTTAGKAEVQKSNIFTIPIEKITDEDSEYSTEINIEDGVDSTGATSGQGWNFSDGVLTITDDGKYNIVGSGSTTENKIVINSGVEAQIRLTDVNIDVSGNDDEAAFNMAGATVNLFLHGENSFTSSDYRAGLETSDGSLLVILDSSTDTEESGTLEANGGYSAAGIGGKYNSGGGTIKIQDGLLNNGYVNATAGDGAEDIGSGEDGISSRLNLEYDPEEAPILRDIPDFYDNNGVFLLNDPQEITITQGNGNQAKVILYSTDTMADVRRKLNDAIANDLGQASYTNNADRFVSFVTEDSAQSMGQESVAYTFLIRSAVAGANGKLTFSSESRDLIQKLGLNTIEEATENVFQVSIFDAHKGSMIEKDIVTSSNKLVGVINNNIDIEFDPNANVKAAWDEDSKRYVLSGDYGNPYKTSIHIVNKSTAFQIGQTEGEDMRIDIGDVTASSLGITQVNVTTRENASRYITVLDGAIRKISIQRTKIGGYQNELTYNANSLVQTSLHLSASESRIKDADMAKETMNFLKLQIINNASSSMLSQSHHMSRASVQSIMMM